MKNKIKYTSVFASVALLTPTLTMISCSNDGEVYVPVDQNLDSTFDVGMSLDYAPYDFVLSPLQYELIKKQSETTDEVIGDGITKAEADIYIEMVAPVKTGGYVAGFDVYLAKKIADQMQKELVVHQMQFETLPSNVSIEKIDAAMDGMSITEEREKIVSFSNEYNVAKNVVLFDNSDFPTGITIDGIRNKRVGVIRSSAQNEIANKLAPIYGFEVVTYDTQYDVETAIKQNAVDIQITEDTAADLVALNDDRLGSIGSLSWVDAYGNARELEDDINPVEDKIGIAFKKNTDLTEVNSVIAATFPDEQAKDSKFKEAEKMYSKYYFHNN